MKIQNFLTTSFQNVRSSKRTDDLHQALLEELTQTYPEFQQLMWKFEYKLDEDAFGGTFDIDLAGFDIETGKLRVAVLAKAINSNVNKNIKNYANTTIGEAARLVYSPYGSCLEKVLFVSILPRVAPRFNKLRQIVGYDDVVSAKERTNISKVLSAQYGDQVQSVDLFYDIEGIRDVVDFDVIGVQNLDRLEEKLVLNS